MKNGKIPKIHGVFAAAVAFMLVLVAPAFAGNPNNGVVNVAAPAFINGDLNADTVATTAPAFIGNVQLTKTLIPAGNNLVFENNSQAEKFTTNIQSTAITGAFTNSTTTNGTATFANITNNGAGNMWAFNTSGTNKTTATAGYAFAVNRAGTFAGNIRNAFVGVKVPSTTLVTFRLVVGNFRN